MQAIANELCVARNTVVADIEVLDKEIAEYGAELALVPGKGMELSCSEGQRFELLFDLYRSVASNTEGEGFFQRLVLGKFSPRFSYSAIFESVREFMDVNKLVLMDSDLYNVVLYIFVAVNFFGQDGRDEGLRTTPSEPSDAALVLYYVGYKLGASVSAETVARFRKYLERNGLSRFIKSVDQIDFCMAISRFLSAIDSEGPYQISQDSVLVEALLAHIMSIKDWGSIEIELPTESTGIDYKRLEMLVDRYVWILEEQLSHSLSINVKRSIVIHICAAIIRNRQISNRLSVAIACPSSVATGKYLEAQIKTYFDFKIVGLFSAREILDVIERKDIHVDLIISTVFIPADQIKVIKVRPFLGMDDLNRIQKAALQERGGATGAHRDMLDSFIQANVVDKDLAQNLQSAVHNTFDAYYQANVRLEQNELAGLLRQEKIRILYSGTLTWEEGIKQAAEPLIQTGDIDRHYVDAMIDNVKEYGDYFVVGNGVALAHAAPYDGVNRDCLSLLVCRDGIKFKETSNLVYLMFCFAVKDVSQYVAHLGCIIDIGKDQAAVEKTRNMTKTGDILSFLSSRTIPAV